MNRAEAEEAKIEVSNLASKCITLQGNILLVAIYVSIRDVN